MNGMSVQERYNDIVKRSGLSEAVVKRVLIATRESIKESLIKGERATIMGIAVFYPKIKTRLQVGGKVKQFIGAGAQISTSMVNELEGYQTFQEDTTPEAENKEPEGIRLKQISALM